MKVSEYNIEYFKFIRDEITKRIQIHYKLVLAKFVLCGAVLAFLIKSPTPMNISPFLVPATLAFLIDILILENLGWIRSAGAYVRQNIENNSPETINWEHDFAQAGGKWACFGARGYRYGIWCIGLLLGISGFIFILHLWFTKHNFNIIDLLLLAITCYLGGYTQILIDDNLGKNSPPMLSNKRQSPIDSE